MTPLLSTFAFYLLAGIIVMSALGVITARNPVHCVLLLILAFFNAAGLFILMGAEFLAMILIIVYVGAIAVLFLFVVMMLDIDQASVRRGFFNYLPLGAVIGGILLFELIAVLLALGADTSASEVAVYVEPQRVQAFDLGVLLYTRYVHFFQLAGLVLLVAMIGAIVLTMSHRTNIKRQQPGLQSTRQVSASIEIKKIKPGQGL